jgi:hypothetical protein
MFNGRLSSLHDSPRSNFVPVRLTVSKSLNIRVEKRSVMFDEAQRLTPLLNQYSPCVPKHNFKASSIKK